jgi:hypothetical protein
MSTGRIASCSSRPDGREGGCPVADKRQLFNYLSCEVAEGPARRQDRRSGIMALRRRQGCLQHPLLAGAHASSRAAPPVRTPSRRFERLASASFLSATPHLHRHHPSRPAKSLQRCIATFSLSVLSLSHAWEEPGCQGASVSSRLAGALAHR